MAVAVTALLVGLLNSTHFADDAADQVAGVVGDARPDEVRGESVWVQVGTGRLTFTVGSPRPRIPEEDHRGPDPDIPEPVAGWTFVPFEVTYEDDRRRPVKARAGEDVDPTELIRIQVSLGGRDHGLSVPEYVSDQSYLRMPTAEADDLTFDVEFDGRTQSASLDGDRETGDFEAFYRIPANDSLERCGVERRRGVPRGVTGVSPARECLHLVWEYPWIEGLGWADERAAKATWVVVKGSRWLREDQIRHHRQTCADEIAMDGDMVVDGVGPTEVIDTASVHDIGEAWFSEVAAYLLPPAPEHEVEFTTTYRCDFGEHTEARTFIDRVTAARVDEAP